VSRRAAAATFRGIFMKTIEKRETRLRPSILRTISGSAYSQPSNGVSRRRQRDAVEIQMRI
jgi:hypothetical protein